MINKILKYIAISLLLLIMVWVIGSVAFVKYNSSRYDISIVPQEQLERLPNSCRYLCYVDSNKPSRENRFYIFDVRNGDCLYAGLVEHVVLSCHACTTIAASDGCLLSAQGQKGI